ncbi:MAG: hypothetical protein KDA90_05375 [Planctomycetaceae bacterium]|nr:hypothetical protein [Planctomycetaceae bacterium]
MDHQDDISIRIAASLAQININLERLQVMLSAVVETTSDHEQRLRSIERWKYNLTPLLAVATFVLGAVFSVALEKYL